MNKSIRSYLAGLVVAVARESFPELSELKSAKKGGGVTLRLKAASGTHFFVVLHFVPDRDDIHLDLAWSRKARLPSEDLWHSQARLLGRASVTLDALFNDQDEGWLRPEEVAPGFPSAFVLEHDHPPLPDVRGIISDPALRHLREAFPTFDEENPRSLEEFGWDLVELFGSEMTEAYVAYAVGSVEPRMRSLLLDYYFPTIRRWAH